MKARIRELLLAQPFQPFIIRAADGRAFTVQHPEFVFVSPADFPLVVVDAGSDRWHYISSLLIASVETAARTA